MRYLFNCLQLVEPVLRTHGSFRAVLSQKAGAGVQVMHGVPEATPSQEMGAGATRTRGGPGATPSREVEAVVLT
jgi:hypothetical protein